VRFSVNGRALPRRREGGWTESADLVVRLHRKRKPTAVGYLARTTSPVPEDRHGLAVSTLGKVIRRGWDWIGLSSSSPGLVGGLVEAPALSVALTLNKGDFVRAGRRGITYLEYRKALQEAVQAQLAAWGEARDREDSARRRAARPLEKDLEAVLRDLADDFPALAALVEQRPGGQKRLPTGSETVDDRGVGEAARGGPGPMPAEPVSAESERSAGEADVGAGEEAAPGGPPSTDEAEPPSPHAVTLPARPVLPDGRKRPTRYGLSIDFEQRPESSALGRLVESTVLVNTAHPAYLRAVASRSEGYHAALSVGLALAEVAVEPAGAQAFLSTFLARWGEAVGRDRRRRQPRARD